MSADDRALLGLILIMFVCWIASSFFTFLSFLVTKHFGLGAGLASMFLLHGGVILWVLGRK